MRRSSETVASAVIVESAVAPSSEITQARQPLGRVLAARGIEAERLGIAAGGDVDGLLEEPARSGRDDGRLGDVLGDGQLEAAVGAVGGLGIGRRRHRRRRRRCGAPASFSADLARWGISRRARTRWPRARPARAIDDDLQPFGGSGDLRAASRLRTFGPLKVEVVPSSGDEADDLERSVSPVSPVPASADPPTGFAATRDLRALGRTHRAADGRRPAEPDVDVALRLGARERRPTALPTRSPTDAVSV